MLYDIVNIINGSFAVLAIMYAVNFLRYIDRKDFIPESVRKRVLRSGFARLGVKCFALGYVVNAVIQETYRDTYTTFTSLFCYFLLFYVSYESYKLIQEKHIMISDIE